MLDFPSVLSTGRVHGRFIIAVIDGPDPGDEPDVIPAKGRIVFKASIEYTTVGEGADAVTMILAPVVGVLDDEGYLCTPHPETGEPMYRGVVLTATDDPGMSVTGWTWSADYRFDPSGTVTYKIPAHSFELPSMADRDLSTLVKVPSSPGYGLPQAEGAALRAEAAAVESGESAAQALSIAQSVRDDADAGLFKGAPGKDGSNVLPTDTAIAQAVSSPGTDSHNAVQTLVDSVTSGSDAVQPLLSIIENATRDAHMLLLGDSTGNETWEWAYLFFQDLASRYPTHTFEYRLWNESTQAYDPAVVFGSGARKVTLWNASVAGAHTQYWLAERFTPAIKAVPADLIMISLGHNEGSGTSYAWAWRARYLALTETLTLSKPTSTIVLVGQNPATANDWQARRVDIYKGIAARQGYGFIDVHAAFKKAGGDLTLDGIHPNQTGARLWADVMLAAFTRTKAEPRTQVQSLLSHKAVQNAMPNGFLSEWNGETPTGWTLAGATVTKDTTGQETGTAAATITSTGANGGVYINLTPAQVKGKRYMLAVRAKVPAGATTMAGRIGFYDNVGGSRLQASGSSPTDGYRWILHEGDFAPTATTARVYIYAGDAGSSVTIDRIILTQGIDPTDAIEIAATASEGGGSNEPAIPWGTPAGLEYANGATSTRLEIRRVGNLVHLLISGMTLPESASNRIIVKVPIGYRSTAGLPTTTSTITQLTGTGDSNPKNLQLMAVSGANVSWNGAVDSTTWLKITQPARLDALLTWYTDDAMPV